MISLLAAILIVSNPVSPQNVNGDLFLVAPAAAAMQAQATEPAHANRFLDSLYASSTYKKWIKFWAARIRPINEERVRFTLTDSASMPPVLPRGETVRAEMRRDSSGAVPMIFSPDRKYFVVLHDKGNTDPSFDIVGLQDSTFTYVTFGPASFFDSAVWLSNKNVVVLGFTFYPSAVRGKGKINMMALDYDFSRRIQRVYTGPDLSWDRYGRYMGERAVIRTGR